MIDVLTDKQDRAVGELRHMRRSTNGNLGETTALPWMFSKKGYIVIEKGKADEEALLSRCSTRVPTICETMMQLGSTECPESSPRCLTP